jgi:hypothetical protein
MMAVMSRCGIAACTNERSIGCLKWSVQQYPGRKSPPGFANRSATKLLLGHGYSTQELPFGTPPAEIPDLVLIDGAGLYLITRFRPAARAVQKIVCAAR